MKKIFISYSHKDEELKKQFETHLSGLKMQKIIDVWDDRQVLIGEKWDKKIKEKLFDSEIVFFLISSDFLSSEYINDIEIKETIIRHDKNEVIIVPVFLRPCDFESSCLSRFQGVPRDAKFITLSDNLDASFLSVIQELKKIILDFKKSDIMPSVVESKLSINNSSDIKTLHQALDLYIQHKDKLSSKTSKDEFEELEKLKTELFDDVFGDLTSKINSIPQLKNQAVISLFEKIISAEKLTTTLTNDIIELRKDFDNYSSYDRSVIVSSLTLSVLTWQIFDYKKIDMLIDFLTDFEDEVWQKSLTGVILSIIIHQNRLQRYPNLIQRLQTLQEIENVQIGIYLIDTILRNQMYEFVIFPKELQADDYLNKTPYNWFYPFYMDNEILTSAIDTTELDSEIDDFIEYINAIPLVGAYKYSLCNGLKNNCISKVVIEDNEIKKERFSRLNTALMFEPYYNLISEIYLYYKYFPKDRVKKLFDSKITIAQTKLKNIVLNKTQNLKLTADLHYERQEYGDCIIKLKELLNLEPNLQSALKQIADCYIEKEEYSEALTYLFQADNLDSDDESNIFNIGACLNETKQYNKSNEYLLRIANTNDRNDDLLSFIGINYKELKEYEKSIEYCLKALEVNGENEISLKTICSNYLLINKPELALDYGLIFNKLYPQKVSTIINLSNIYVDLDENEIALELSEKAFLLENNNVYVVFNYGRVLFVNEKYSKSEIIFNKVFSLKDSESFRGVTYGNLGHIKLFENDFINSDIYYKKCVLEFDDIKDFEEKFDTDLKFAMNAGIPEKKYNEIKRDLILYWQLNKK